MKKFLAIGLFMALAAGTVTQVGAAERNPVLTKAQAKELAKSASTPEQHLKLAEYYRWEYNNFMAESRNYAAMADQHSVPFTVSHPITKFPTFGQHCRSVSEQYLKDANKTEALAHVHEQMGEAGGSK